LPATIETLEQLTRRNPPRTKAEPHSFRGHIFSFVGCVFLAILFTLPSSLETRAGLLGNSGDNFQHAWFLWHFAHAVVKLQNPFYTDLLYYPNTVNLSWSTTDPLAGFLALPVSLALSPAAAYNFSIVLQLALAAFVARLLCLRVCSNETASMIAGVCFGFSPFLMAHALGHLSLVTAFPVPLYFIALDRVLQKAVPGWKDGALLGGSLLLTALAHYNYTVICVIATMVVVAVELVLAGLETLRRTGKALGWGAATFLVAFSPLLIMLIGNAEDRPKPRPFDHLKQYSADVFGFLIPSWNHILFGHFARGLDRSLFVAGYEGVVYASPIILFLAMVGFWKGWTPHRRWAAHAGVLALVFYFLSLGPALRFFGHQTEIPGPAALLYRVPFARFVSAPARFDVITALSLAVLVSLGVTFLLRRWPKTGQRYVLAAVVAVLLLLDLPTIPFPVSSEADPAWSPGASRQPVACSLPATLQHGTVLTFPLIDWPYSMKSMWMQVADRGRYRLVDGYLSYSADRIWSDYYGNPIVRSLLSIQGEFHTPVDAQVDRRVAGAAFRELNASAVVIFDSPKQEEAERYIETVLQKPGQRAGSCTIFAIAAPGPVGMK
jgi:hypothetical protein